MCLGTGICIAGTEEAVFCEMEKGLLCSCKDRKQAFGCGIGLFSEAFLEKIQHLIPHASDFAEYMPASLRAQKPVIPVKSGLGRGTDEETDMRHGLLEREQASPGMARLAGNDDLPGLQGLIQKLCGKHGVFPGEGGAIFSKNGMLRDLLLQKQMRHIVGFAPVLRIERKVLMTDRVTAGTEDVRSETCMIQVSGLHDMSCFKTAGDQNEIRRLRIVGDKNEIRDSIHKILMQHGTLLSS